MLTLETLRAQYRNKILELAEQHGVENIRVFGSVARGDQDEKSDLDLLYALKPPSGLWEACGMYGLLEEMLPCKLDFVCEDNLRPHVKQSILTEAIPL